MKLCVMECPYPSTPIAAAGGPYAANPNSHAKCNLNLFTQAFASPSNSPVSDPNNLSLSPSLRNQNPVDVSNGSPTGRQFGGVNGTTYPPMMVFPNLAQGLNAAMTSLQTYASKGFTISDLVDTWAPPKDNPNAMSNFLSILGISSYLVNSTDLDMLTATQQMQVISAFAWGEGYKPTGC